MNLSFKEQLETNLQIEYLPQYDPYFEEGLAQIKAIVYDGVRLSGKKTKVFAYMAFPKNCSLPVPAVVLVHGGGCHPDCAWINEWTSRGYAVIAPDTTGHFPGEHHTSFTESERGNWLRELPADVAAVEYTVPPANSGMNDTEIAIEDRWMYHAVSQVILAHNILRADNRIDREKIGISGISWGGVITAITIGYDTRFAYAIPIYGSAYLSVGLTKINEPFRMKGNECWQAEHQYDQVKIPVMWLCWNDDCCFSINSNSRSYVRTVKNNPVTVLTMRNRMNHSHTHALQCTESYWYAERILSEEAIPHISVEVQDRVLNFSCSEEPKEIRLFYITGRYNYARRVKYDVDNLFMDKDWQILRIDNGVQQICLPEDAFCYYLEFLLEDDIVLCSEFFEESINNKMKKI